MSEGHTERLEAALDGKYLIERKLGEGGMATVYLAQDVKHKRKVALKILKPELAAVIGAERFLTEITTTAGLQHPHILALHDSGEASGYLYYVMPYIEGETLKDKLDREKQLGVEESVRIARDVADALDYAHRQGVIHRDIKPGNILLHDGRPVVADFGIALAVSAAGGGRMTETGLSLGTPHYMSPEQASADRDLSARSDVYSLGCVLYEMIGGQPPHTGPSAQSILVHILTKEATPLTELRHTVPPHVAATVAKSIEKLPADRFDSAKAFMEALGDEGFTYRAKPTTAAVAVDPVVVTSSSSGQWNRLTFGFASLAAVLALAFGWTLLRPVPQGPGTVRQVLSTEGWAGLDNAVGRFMALAPDGSSMVLPLGEQLGLKLAGSVDVVPISGTEGARDVTYSPDGQSIAYAVGTEVYRTQLVGGSPIRLAEDGEVEPNRIAMAWFDDGTFLYERADRQVVLIPENGGEPLATIAGMGALTWLHGLPGGQGALAVTTPNELYVVDLRAGSTDLLLNEVVRAWYAPTGHLVYVRTDGAVFALPFDLQGLGVTGGGAVPLFDGVRLTNDRADMHLAPDGTLLYVEGSSGAFTTQTRQLTLIDREGNSEALSLSPRSIPNLALGWSPDGESITYASDGHIYTYNVVLDSPPRQITLEGDNLLPVFSPDGQRVVFASARQATDGLDLFVKDLNDPSSPPRLLLTLEGDQVVTQWPVDTLIVFESMTSSGMGDLWLLDLSEPEAPEARPYLESEANLRRMVVSPDGTLAAYRSSASAGSVVQGAIYINSFPNPGAPELVSRSDAYVPMWSPDGQTLYYVVAPGQPVVAARLQTEPVPIVLEIDTLFIMPPVVNEPHPAATLHPDGERFLLAVGGEALESDGTGGVRSPRLILVSSWFDELLERVGEN